MRHSTARQRRGREWRCLILLLLAALAVGGVPQVRPAPPATRLVAERTSGRETPRDGLSRTAARAPHVRVAPSDATFDDVAFDPLVAGVLPASEGERAIHAPPRPGAAANGLALVHRQRPPPPARS